MLSTEGASRQIVELETAEILQRNKSQANIIFIILVSESSYIVLVYYHNNQTEMKNMFFTTKLEAYPSE